MSQLLSGVLLLLIALVIRALALSVARQMVRGWAWVYTWGLPRDMRDRRRKEIASDVRDHIVTLSDQERLASEVIAVHVLLAWLRGVPSDLGWLFGNLLLKVPRPAERVFFASLWTGLTTGAIVGGVLGTFAISPLFGIQRSWLALVESLAIIVPFAAVDYYLMIQWHKLSHGAHR